MLISCSRNSRNPRSQLRPSLSHPKTLFTERAGKSKKETKTEREGCLDRLRDRVMEIVKESERKREKKKRDGDSKRE